MLIILHHSISKSLSTLNMMNSINSHKKQFLIVAALAIFGVLLCYHLAFKRTYLAYRLYKDELSKLETSNQLPQTIDSYKVELNALDNIIGNNDTLNRNTKQLLIDETARYCDSSGLNIKEVPKSLSETKSNFDVETVVIVIEGKYQRLLKYLYNFEQHRKIGKTSSVSFYIVNDFISKKEYLHLRTCTQFIKASEKQNK